MWILFTYIGWTHLIFFYHAPTITQASTLIVRFFFRFLKFFTYMSIHFRFRHSHHHNLHKILLLFIYHMIKVGHVLQQVEIILMCEIGWKLVRWKNYQVKIRMNCKIFGFSHHDHGFDLLTWYETSQQKQTKKLHITCVLDQR